MIMNLLCQQLSTMAPTLVKVIAHSPREVVMTATLLQAMCTKIVTYTPVGRLPSIDSNKSILSKFVLTIPIFRLSHHPILLLP
jgi:hypothetical protein